MYLVYTKSPHYMPDKPVLFFDINETLLDMSPVKKAIKESLELDDEAVKRWFTTLLHYSLVTSAGGKYEDFGKIGAETLRMIAAEYDKEISLSEAQEILKPIKDLPPHDDVPEALQALTASGYRLLALTNGEEEALKSQVDNAGLAEYFEVLLSVEKIGKFKPYTEVYDWAATQAGVDPGNCMLIAAHPWDIAGAACAGWQTVYLKRSKTPHFDLTKAPDYTIDNLGKLAEALG